MINFKTIAKVLLVALFVCAYSGQGWCQSTFVQTLEKQDENTKNSFANGKTVAQTMTENDKMMKDAGKEIGKGNLGKKKDEDKAQKSATVGNNGSTSSTPANFCSSDLGLFSSLVTTGTLIFKRLRDLIYVVAGFGIIAVAVGGFFGNLNWKWLGAIVISLVVIATAGELISLITGCEQFGSTLITNTITNPTAMSQAEYQEMYTEQSEAGSEIQWNDKVAREHPDIYAGYKVKATSEYAGNDGTDPEVDKGGNWTASESSEEDQTFTN